MDGIDFKTVSENPETNSLAAIGSKVEYCMQQYRPYIRHDFSLYHLSLITNIPESDLEYFFSQSRQTFSKYIDEWRVNYAKNLMNEEKAKGMETKTIASLSGFSSARKFIEAFQNTEGISPETYQSQINESK